MNENQKKVPAIELGAAGFESEVLGSRLPVMVEFWAPWSRPCRILDSALNEAAISCAGRVKVVKVNADDNPDLSLWYGVQSIPTLLYFDAGGLRARLVGTVSKQAILSKLQAVSPGGDANSPPKPGT
jgi:thioredoxin 1